MYCSRLLMLNSIFTDSELQKVDSFFYNLTVSESRVITPSRVSEKLCVSLEKALQILLNCAEIDVLIKKYAVRCDSCGMLLKEYDDIKDIPLEHVIDCYACDENFVINEGNVILFFSLNNQYYPFEVGQHNTEVDLQSVNVAPEDSLASLAKSVVAIQDILCKTYYDRKEVDIEELALNKQAIKIKNRRMVLKVTLSIAAFIIAVIIAYKIYIMCGDEEGKGTIIDIMIAVVTFIIEVIINNVICTDIAAIKEQLKYR